MSDLHYGWVLESVDKTYFTGDLNNSTDKILGARIYLTEKQAREDKNLFQLKNYELVEILAQKVFSN